MGDPVMVTVIPGDSWEVLPMLAGTRIDAIVTDPPYHLLSTVKRFGSPTAAPASSAIGQRLSKGFMSMTWDGGDIAQDPEFWRLCYDLLPPGGHLAAFSSPRTVHRMTCAIEDAGFEIRDSLMWLFGTGFPKSHDVSKAIDKAAGAEREVIGTHHRHGGGSAVSGSMSGPLGTASALPLTAPATDAAKQWAGWGSALKPSYEPIVLARKPLDGTLAGNVLEHGVGALNIDACRVPLTEGARDAKDNTVGDSQRGYRTLNGGMNRGCAVVGETTLGRWPANVLHDGSDEVLSYFPIAPGQNGRVGGAYAPSPGYSGGFTRERTEAVPRVETDKSAARFFYSAKATKADRAGSGHPTVKPIALMEWLIKLITPPGGTVLDPFAGSGTTGAATRNTGHHAILIEREEQYRADILRRLG